LVFLVVFGCCWPSVSSPSSARRDLFEVFWWRRSIWLKDSSTDAYPVCHVTTCVFSFLRVAGTRVSLDSSGLSM
jgi:hypothetical protein